MTASCYKNILILISLLFFPSITIYGATPGDSLRIRVYDVGDNRPVEFCNIIAKNIPTGALADEWGRASLRVGPKTLRDTLLLSSVGYEKLMVALNPEIAGTDTLRIYMSPKEYPLSEVTVRPAKKAKVIKKGKRHKGGMIMNVEMVGRGDCYAWEAGKKDRRTWLTGIEMQSWQYADSSQRATTDSIAATKGKTGLHPLEQTRIRINVYDATNKSRKSGGFERWDYENVLREPVIIHYTKEQVIDDIFSYTFKEPVLLPEQALVEIEILDEIPENEAIFFKSNLFGRNVMSRHINDRFWIKFPGATPFTLLFLEEKTSH